MVKTQIVEVHPLNPIALRMTNMAAELVGEALLSAIFDVLFDRLACGDVVDCLCGKKLGDKLINNLKTLLSAVDAVLDDAEEKQITNPNV
ncbi:putative disease resistance RPP13-like protein 1 [Ziziphus jujuba]|uniref:Disease resistance RPP13-like protein 1 n=1 Tax=Ziziphus jujuba TaxID=326968 RepID=A0ABM3ZZ16_ZIZJJ|nr:putative disease resistance RPP13-like protein 1 [Ziziphus jujuba]